MHIYIDQAEQIAILNVLEKLELQYGQDNDKRAAIYTDRKITLDLLQSNFKRDRLIEWIRGKIIALTHLKWIMHFGWVKEPAWIRGEWIGGQTRKRSSSGIWAKRVRQNINRGAYNSSEGKDLIRGNSSGGIRGRGQWLNVFPRQWRPDYEKEFLFSKSLNIGDRTWEAKITPP